MADVSVSQQQGKRRRGRPRKDNNVCRDGENLCSSSVMKTQLQVPDNNSNNGNGNGNGNGCVDMIGSAVYGVIEGSFDAGYLISVTIGDERTPFRGVVFQPKKIIPISPANDVAPQANMYERRTIAVLDQNQTSPPERASKQAVVRPSSVPVSSNHDAMMMESGNTTVGDMANVDPSGSGRSLKMVEEDEVMQAFEVSTSSGSNHHKNMPQSTFHMIDHRPRPFIELLHQPANTEEVQQPIYYNELRGTNVSFQQNIFNDPKSLSEAQLIHPTSHNLKLSLEKAEPQSETSYGFHQALVAGNPLLLPPDLTQESRGDGERLVGDNTRSITRPTSETNYCMNGVDFVLNDHAESHHHQTEASQTIHIPHSAD